MAEDLKTTDTNARYIAYSRLLARLSRYLAFTSDVGEAFRPLAHPYVVKGTYGISWLYVIGDVAFEGKKEKEKGSDSRKVNLVMAERAVFQVVASMAIPAFLIHSSVHFVSNACKKYGRFQKWGPTFAGLALIPFLPLFLDEPVEYVVQKGFH